MKPGWPAWAAGRVPRRLTQSAHASLREEWFAGVGAQNASEVLAVQTLRNALMSATMTASTAALALMGTLALTALSLHSSLDVGSTAAMTPQVALELALLASLLGSLFASTMAVRYYYHAGFIRAIPVESEARAMERHGQCVRAPGRSTVPLGLAPAHPRGAHDGRARATAVRPRRRYSVRGMTPPIGNARSEQATILPMSATGDRPLPREPSGRYGSIGDGREAWQRSLSSHERGRDRGTAGPATSPVCLSLSRSAPG
jgi:hypothetical protein